MCSSCGNSIVHAEPKEYDGFVNLHLHTNKSLLDGLSHPKDVIKKVASLKQSAVAVTEHGNVFSSVEVHKLAKKENIKHIYGMEAYIAEDRFVKDSNSRYYHITLLAKNEQGRLNLNKLASIGFLEGLYYKPRIDFKLLAEHREGIIVLSGCMGSLLQQTLAGGKIGDCERVEITEENILKAKNHVNEMREIHGFDYYLEIQAHVEYKQQQLNRAIVDIGKELNIPVVATTDSHMVEEEDFELHSVFIQIGQNREAGETYSDTFIMSAKEVYDRLPNLTEEERDSAIKMSLLIALQCNVNLPLSEAIIPNVPIPKKFASQVAYMKNLLQAGWKKRQIHLMPNKIQEIYKERLLFEVHALEQMGFEGYILLVDSYAKKSEERGAGRGSAGGSLVSYLLNITDVDPILYGLYFERFIDVSALDKLESGEITKKQLKIPDVDLDFSPKARQLIVDDIINTYGNEKFVKLGTFQYIWDKSAIKDIGRVLGVPFSTTNKISQQMGELSIEYCLFAGMFQEEVEKYPKLFEYAKKLSGTPKSYGVHPCASAITTENETQFYSAVALSKDGSIVIQGDMHDAEDLGMVKIDLLSIKSLEVVHDCLHSIDKTYNEYLSPVNVDFGSDEKVFEIFSNSLTDGIFQFESLGMKETLKKVRPSSISELAVCNALFRPSSIKYIDHYAKRKFGKEKVVYLHPDLEDILGDTFGIWVYQEQMISLAKLSGMKNPDSIRKAIGKFLAS